MKFKSFDNQVTFQGIILGAPIENTWAISLNQQVTKFNHPLIEIKRPRDPLELPSSRYNTRISMERVFQTHKVHIIKSDYKMRNKAGFVPIQLSSPSLGSKN